MRGRAPAAVVVERAAPHDADEDECHARDAEEMRRVLRGESAIRHVMDRSEVERDVEYARHHHQREADEHHRRHAAEPSRAFYHEHSL